jgi:hypothetical protein
MPVFAITLLWRQFTIPWSAAVPQPRMFRRKPECRATRAALFMCNQNYDEFTWIPTFVDMVFDGEYFEKGA